MSTPVRLRASSLIETRDGTPSNKDSRLFNCLVEPNGEELDFLKRGGYSQLFSPGTGAGRGAILVTDASGNAQFLTVVGNTLYKSVYQTSVTWTSRTAAAANSWRSVAWSPSLSLFAAVSSTGSGNQVMTSPDGITWTSRTDAGSAAWWDITWSPERAIFCAIANSGISGTRVMTSPDGITWTLRTTPENNQWQSVAWSPELLLFVAVSDNGTNRVMTSPDGITWTSRSASSALGWSGVAWSPELGLFASVATNGTGNGVMTSPDGITWTARAPAADTGWRSIVWARGLGLFVAVSQSGISNSVMTSDDGVSWSIRTAAAAKQWADIAWGEEAGILVAVAAQSDADAIMISKDAITWTTSTPAQNNQWNGVIWSPSLSRFVTVSLNGTSRVQTGVDSSGFSSTSIGTLTIGGFFDFSQTLDRTQIALKNTAGAWQYTVASSTLTQVSDPDYPATTVRGLVYLNGVFYVMDQYGKIYGSGTNDFTSWAALNFINAQSEPDAGVCLIKYNQYVVALGAYTVQFFFNNPQNATGSPLSPVQNADLLIGCVNGDCVAQAQSSVFFPARSKGFGQSANNKIFVAELSGMSYKKISTPDIDRILNADGLDGAWGWFGVWMGHPCYCLTLAVTGYTLAYDLSQPGEWYIFTKQTADSSVSVTSITCAASYAGSTVGIATVTATSHGFADGDPVVIAGASPSGYNGTFNITRTSANEFTYPTSTVLATATGTITATGSSPNVFPALCAFAYDGTQVFQNKLNGAICTLSDTLYTDDSNYIDMLLRTARFDQGLSQQGNSQNKFMPWLDFISDKTSTTTNVLIRWTDDDYQTYNNYRAVDISQNRSRLSRCGSFLRRAFDFRHTANAAHRMQGIDVGLEQGGE